MASNIRLLVAFHEHMGPANSFAVFETYYTHTKFLTVGPSAISWIGSLQLFLTLFIGIFAGWFLDAGYVRVVVATGTGFEVIGMLVTSFCKRYWHLVLAQGLCVGIGSGMLAFISAAVILLYFVKRRMLVAGIFSTGSSIGFTWAVRILALVMLIALLASLAALRPHTRTKKHGPLFKVSFLRDTPYTLFILAYAFMVAGVYVLYFFIQSYALDLGINERMTFNIIGIMNAATFFGCFPYNYLADIYGGIAVLVLCCLFTSVILFLWRFVHTLSGLIVVSATYCFVTGGLVSLLAVTIANNTNDKSDYGTRMGMGYTVAAIGARVGNPIAAAAKKGTSGVTLLEGGLDEVIQQWQGA